MLLVAIPSDIDARRYWRVAYQRYEDGRLLLEINRFQAAVYLTGYAVECMLKALLIASTPPKARLAVTASFRGAIAHDIGWLREQLVARIGRLPVSAARSVTFVSSWSTDLRYEPGPGDPDDAEAFRAAAEAILRWADGRM